MLARLSISNACAILRRGSKSPRRLAPWVNLDSLLRADHDIAFQLFDRCQSAQRMLGGDSAARLRQRRIVFALLAAALAGLVVAIVLTLYHGGPMTWPAVLSAQRWLGRIRRTLGRNGSQQRLILGGVAAIVATMAAVWWSAKRN